MKRFNMPYAFWHELIFVESYSVGPEDLHHYMLMILFVAIPSGTWSIAERLGMLLEIAWGIKMESYTDNFFNCLTIEYSLL